MNAQREQTEQVPETSAAGNSTSKNTQNTATLTQQTSATPGNESPPSSPHQGSAIDALAGAAAAGSVLTGAGNAHETTGPRKKIEEYKPYIENLENGLEKLPDHKGSVFRGENMDADRFMKDFANQSEYEVPQFFSTSTDKGFWGNAKFFISSKKGKNIAPISEFGDTELEVLFPKKTKFKILEATESGGNYEIFLQEMQGISKWIEN